MKKLIKYFLIFVTCMVSLTVYGYPHSHHSSPHIYNNHHIYSNHTHTTHHSRSNTHTITKPHTWTKTNSRFSENCHSMSHVINNYSQPKKQHYNTSVHYFTSPSPYHIYYHHYHVGEHQDTVFCANESHDKPIFEDDSSNSDRDGTAGVLIFVFIIFIVVYGAITLFS